jgi:cyanophycinase-like exopeptidase
MSDLLIALLGSGEFEPWSAEVDRLLLARARPGPVLVMPTASAPEGDGVFEAWATKGSDYYTSLGIEAEVLPLRNREDAFNAGMAARVESAAMVYFSGGNPAYLAATLTGTPFWQTLQDELRRGLAYVGCSAGAACLGDVAPDSDLDRLVPELWCPGLGFLPGVWIGPHWNMLDSYVPGLRDFFLRSVPPTARLICIDESTAIVGDGSSWSVVGVAAAHSQVNGEWHDYPAGQALSLDLLRLA